MVSEQAWRTYIRRSRQIGHLSQDGKINADRILRDQFLFDGPYAMEPTQTEFTMNPIAWQQTPNGDPEWLYMLKRQEYLLDLLQAWYETDDAAYQQKMKDLIFCWIDGNLESPDTWRTIDTGIRLLNWTAAVANLVEDGQLSAYESARIDEAVDKQVKYLQQNYIEKYDISNWGILITTGILTYAARFAGAVDNDATSWAQERFELQLELQIDAQGMHWEQSPLYLLEVWRSSLAVIAARQHAKVSTSPMVIDKAKAMQRMIAHYIKPDLILLQQGDTDAIRIDSLYNASAAILNQPSSLQRRLDPVFDFMLLELAHQDWGREKIEAGLPCQFAASASGNHFWRTDWGKDADYHHLFNGSLGSGHGHAALGHIDLVIGGHDVLVDPGRYTYVDGTERRYLKSASAHNTLMLDQRPFSMPRDSWKYEYVSNPVSNQVVDFDGGQMIKATYLDSSQPQAALITRMLVNLKALRIWFVIDVVNYPGRHSLKRFWQIAPELDVSERCGIYALGDKAQALFTETCIRSSRQLFSSQYNKLRHLTRLETKISFVDFTVQAAVFTPFGIAGALRSIAASQSGGGDSTVPQRLASGFQVDLEGGQNVLVTIQPENTIKGRKLYWFDRTEAYGNVNIFIRRSQRIVKHMQVL